MLVEACIVRNKFLGLVFCLGPLTGFACYDA